MAGILTGLLKMARHTLGPTWASDVVIMDGSSVERHNLPDLQKNAVCVFSSLDLR